MSKPFAISQKVENPSVVITKNGLRGKEFSEEARNGKFRRVFPSNGNEHSAILMLGLQEERFAPAKGDGVIITERAFKNFRS